MPGRLPQNPVSRPTEKQLLSWLNATDRATGPVASLIAALVFIVVSGKTREVIKATHGVV